MNCGPHLVKSLVGAAALAVAGWAHAGIELDLTSAGAFGTINGGTYRQTSQQPTGTGYIDPFVRIGMQGSAGKDVVNAYNTTVDGVLNNSNEDNWNHAVTFGQMQIQGNGANSYVRFLLDINQTGSNPRLNLDDVQIFISSSPNQSVATFSADGLVNLAGTQVYRMDNAGTSAPPANCQGNNNCGAYDGSNRVSLDFSLGSGSGSGDMYLDIPVAKFNTAFGLAGISSPNQAGTYIYLYSKFGSNPYNNNDGFEEWAFLAKISPTDGPGFSTPEPSSLVLAGLGLLAAGVSRRRQRTAA
jgi:hypothetical protein